MAERITRSSSSAERITKPHVAQPFNVSKRKLRKDHSDSEKEKIKKHEIQEEQFTYRLHSVKDILKKINDDQENDEENDGSAKKKRRRSNLMRGKRRSIAETVLRKNLQKEIEKEGAIANSGANTEAISDEKPEDANVIHESKRKNEDETQIEVGEQKDGDELQKLEETRNIQASTHVSDESGDLTSVAEESCVDSKERTAVQSVTNESTTSKQTQVPIQPKADEKQQQKRPKKLISSAKLVTEEEIAAKKDRELERRKNILEKIRILKKEQEAWAQLYASYQDRLSEAESNQTETTSSGNEEYFTEEYRQFLESRINPGEFIERLKNYRDEYMTQSNHLREFFTWLQTFKQHAAEYLSKSVSNIVGDEKREEEEFKTPRRLITKIVEAEPSSA